VPEPAARPPLGQDAVRRHLSGLASSLGARSMQRLTRLSQLIGDDGYVNLAVALEALFPDSDRPLDYFRQLRQTLRDEAEETGSQLVLHVDARKSAPRTRRCWFSGPDPVEDRVADASRAAVAQGPDQTSIPLDATVISHSDTEPPLRVLLSYHPNDRTTALKLRRLLESHLAIKPGRRAVLWDPSDGPLGSKSSEEWRNRRDSSDLIVVLATVRYLAELGDQLAALRDDERYGDRLIVAELEQVPRTSVVTPAGFRPGEVFAPLDIAFTETREPQQQRWVADLADKIHSKALTVPARPEKPAPLPAIVGEQELEKLARQLHNRNPADDERIELLARQESLVKHRADRAAVSERAADAVPVLSALEAWITKPSGAPYCALLGEYGFGKTTTCRQFTRQLLTLRETDPAVPIPVYLDLRNVPDAVRTSAGGVAAIIDSVLVAQDDRADRPSAEDVLTLVRDGRAVVIFDGLDEILVKLSEADGQRFARLLWNAIPPRNTLSRNVDAGEAALPARQGRMLVTCRDHYFRSFSDQVSYLAGQDRGRTTAEDYLALVLTPLDLGQIRGYLERALPDAEAAEAAFSLLSGVHNLLDLAQRPFLLAHLVSNLREIEAAVEAGQAFNAAALYTFIVNEWLDRDNGKHTIKPEHKIQLMEDLAHSQWATSRASWSISNAEEWLVERVAGDAKLATRYSKAAWELLEEDLRTATFLVRTGEDQFRFAHTSLLEYFLARRLVRALETSVSCWPSPRRRCTNDAQRPLPCWPLKRAPEAQSCCWPTRSGPTPPISLCQTW
jgi:hypothetical protein